MTPPDPLLTALLDALLAYWQEHRAELPGKKRGDPLEAALFNTAPPPRRGFSLRTIASSG